MEINNKTKICCIIGNPVAHSLSPTMHNAAYEARGLNFAYFAFQVTNVKDAIEGMKALGIQGISITVPYKVTAMQYVDKIDPISKKIASINTIFNKNGQLIGSNTDWEAAIRSIEEKVKLSNKKVILIGAGGAARAIVFGLKRKGATVLILNRNMDHAKALADELDCTYNDLSALSEIQNSDILIHATPTGMYPQGEESLVPKELLRKSLIVFDIVYNPKETKLLADAKAKGCIIVYGYKMLLYQAIAQFELFTGKKAPAEVMEKALLQALDPHYA